ncbi:hypothetical protein E4U21_005107 [Claviceps maximensis]|nr:hypothetical protein E4U21_005107 [Claviceps maximensis]
MAQPSQVPDETRRIEAANMSEEDVAISSGPDPAPPQTMPVTQFWLLSLGVCLGLLLAMMDTSIVATSLHSIGSEFDDLADVNWVALAYTLAYMGCAVVFARVSDLTGRQAAVVAAFVIFVVFSLACGWARSMHQLIAFRALQGVGGSGLYSLAMIVLPETSPMHLRQHISATIGFVVAMAGVLGPVLGGLLTHYASWRWIFWINGPIGAAALAIFLLSWPRKEEHRPVLHGHSWKQLDCPGAFLTTAAAVLVVFAFQNTGDNNNGNHWNSALFIVPLVLGIVFWIALFVWQYTIERHLASRFSPIFPIRLFRHAMYTSGLLNTLLLGFPYLLLIYDVPLRIQVVGDKSALLAGVMLLPMLAAVAVGSIVSGAVNSRKSMIVESLLAGSCLMLLGCGLLTTLSTKELDTAKLLGLITFCGLGFGLTVSSSTLIAARDVPRRDYASAQGILAQLRILGGSLGIAASTAILRNEMNGAASFSYPSSSSHVSRAEQAAVLDNEARRHVKESYAQAFHTDMIVATIISGLAVAFTLVALLLQQKQSRMRRETSSSSSPAGEKSPSAGDD